VKLFGEVARGLAATNQNSSYLSRPARSLIRTELRVGLRDLACEHAALFVSPNSAGFNTSGETVYELLFPLDPVAAETLFLLLRQHRVPGDQPGASMIRARDLLSGTAGPAAVDEAATLLRESAGLTAANAPLLKARRYFALAMVLRAAKRAEAAEAAFKSAAEITATADGAATAPGGRYWVHGAPDPARVWLEWGDYLSELGRHRAAAAVYEAGWRLFPDQPLPLLLWGQALVAAGDAKEGAKRLELAHWVSLGNEKVRGRFLDELTRRGAAQALRREVGLISKACWSNSHMFGNVMNQCSRACFLAGDFERAEVCGTRALLVVMRKPGIYYVDPAGYLNVPNELLAFRARALLEAGKVAEAVAAAREVLSVTPGYMELVTGMVPALDRAGHKFELTWEAHQKVLKEFPESGPARGALAQLSGQCNRRLDDGLKYAKEAVASDPESPGYREWLAEVHFRRGERAAALKAMQALADEHPRSFLYRRQLARYRDAAFDSPWPLTAD
jgi:tetratricopeptide (TPR) repeat protein